MGYSVYVDHNARDYGVDRWAGYGVPAECDEAECTTEIDRRLAYKCEEHVWYEEPDDDDYIEHVDEGCGLYFCSDHFGRVGKHEGVKPKPDSDAWVYWMVHEESWARWRDEDPERLALHEERVSALSPDALAKARAFHDEEVAA